MSLDAPATDPHPDGREALRGLGRAARSGGAVALGLGLTGVQALMRPDDVPPGRRRTAYRLAFGGLGAAASLLTALPSPSEDTQAADDALDPRTARRIELGVTAGVGILSAALFHPRVGANWWGDRALARLGVRDTRTAGALVTVAATAGLVVFSERMDRWASTR